MTRHFRAQNDAAYEAVRRALDSAYGYPNAATKTVTAIPPASESPRDSSGRVYFTASDAECEYPAAATLLPQALDSGLVEEVDGPTYEQEVPRPQLVAEERPDVAPDQN